MPQLRDGSFVEDPRLARIPQFDPRSLNFPVSARLATLDAPQQPITREWACPLFLDQGQEGSCVGHGFAHEAAANPVAVPNVTERFAHDIVYWGAQRIDDMPGGSYPGANPQYEGTSVLAGAKFMTNTLGAYTAYHWALNEAQVALAISYLGPVVLGVNWYQNMYHPDRNGYLHPTGPRVGGHCILATGYNAQQRSYTLHNSWGTTWGNGGTAKISATALAWLLAQQGEACIPDGRKLITIS